jgi:hypothetical protein
MVDATMGKYLTQFVQLNFTANESVRKFARFNGERADIARQLFRFLVNPFTEDHLENASSWFAERAKDQCHEMGINSDWRKGWRRE